MGGNVELRRALHEATRIRVPDGYREEIERLRQAFGHAITVLEHDYGPYNRGEPEPSCYALALGVAQDAEYLRLVGEALHATGLQPLTAARVTALLGAKILRHRRASVRVGDIALYLADDEIRHAGIVIKSTARIRSNGGRPKFTSTSNGRCRSVTGITCNFASVPRPCVSLPLSKHSGGDFVDHRQVADRAAVIAPCKSTSVWGH